MHNTIYDDGNVKVVHIEGDVIDDLPMPPGHWYLLCPSVDEPGAFHQQVLHFQNGPIKQVGVNGINTEATLAALIHRTKMLDEKFPCDENKMAIVMMEAALVQFQARTKDRQRRGVEGQNIV